MKANVNKIKPRLTKWAKKVTDIKVDSRARKLRGRHLSRPCRQFQGPLAAILDFEDLVALQAVSKCPRRH